MSKRIKLLHVGSSHRMGLTNQETSLALAYHKLGALDLVVVSGENEQVEGCFTKLREAGIPSVQIAGFDEHQDLFRLIREFADIVERECPNVVSVNTNWQLLISGLARWFGPCRFRILYTVHGFRHNHRWKSVVARIVIGFLLFVFADRINAPSGYVRKQFALLSYKIGSVPLGEDDIFFEHSKQPDFSKPLKFCFPGEFRKGKNQFLLIQAFAEYVQKTGDTDASLTLPGEGELLEQAKRLAEHLGLQDRVFFPGQLDRRKMLEAYQVCQIVVVPSNTETFGHCVVEPLVMKRIVVARPVGIAPDVVKHGVNGFLYSDKSQLIQRMIEIKSMEPAKLKHIAGNAGLAGLTFNWASIARKNVDELLAPLLFISER